MAALLLALVCDGAERPVDVLHYDIAVRVRKDRLEVTVDIKARADEIPKKWELVLARTMRVKAVDGVPFTVRGDAVVLDLSGVEPGTFRVTFRLEGAPSTRFSAKRGGFVRTAITPDIAYVRSQYPWYPRNGDNDAATFRVRVQAPDGWVVRTAAGAGRDRPSRRIGLVAAPYDKVALGPDLDALVPKGDNEGVRALLEGTRKAFAHYRGRLGKIDLPRFTLVRMPDAFGPNSGYGEDGYILVGRRGGLPLVAHEVAHSWWGHEVDFSDFASEMLATYVTLGFLEAELGAAAAVRERRNAVESVLNCAKAGKEISLREMKGFGAGQDPQTYRAHAYDKGAMIFVMLADAIGAEKLDGILAAIVEANRGKVYNYKRLREDLAKRGGASARRLLAQWEEPGIPTLEIAYKTGRGTVKGTLSQKGTRRPFAMQVTVRALCGGTHADTTVKLRGKKATFSLKVPAEPESVVIDPEYRIVAARTIAGLPDFDEIWKVASNPGLADKKVLEKAIADLRRLLSAGQKEDLCRVGIGRCLFRLGKLDDAKKQLSEAVRLGLSPFHRQWARLRLGCIADLRKNRKQAMEHYRAAVAIRPGAFSAKKAQRFLERPYRGQAKDG